MIVTCPNCTTRFLVPDDAIGTTGRRVKCGACGHLWLAVPDRDDDEAAFYLDPDPSAEDGADTVASPPSAPASAPAPAPEASDDAADTGSGADITAQRTNLPAVIEPRRSFVLWGWVAFGLLVAALIAGIMLGRGLITERFPQTAPLYQRLDALVGSGATGSAEPAPRLEIGGLQSRTGENSDGDPVVIVSGSISNPSAQTINVPPLRADIMDADGNLLQSWGFSVRSRRLAPEAEITFEQAFINPPAGGVRLAVVFDVGDSRDTGDAAP